MSNSLKPDEFRESVYRCFPGVKTDPFLAERIIASEKGETKMKKKISFSLAFVLVALLVLAAAACAATVLNRQVNWQGEPVETEAPDWPEFPTEEEDENIGIMNSLADSVPDGDYAYAWYDLPDTGYANEHPKQKNFTSFEEFRQYMADWSYLTVPAWLPEDVKTVSAKVILESRVNLEKDALEWELPENGIWSRKGTEAVYMPEDGEEGETGLDDWSTGGYYRKIEERKAGKDGKVEFIHYTLDDADAVVTGYDLVLGFEDRPDIEVLSNLDISIGEHSFLVTADETVSNPEVEGMSDVLLITAPGGDTKDRLFLHRNLESPVEYSDAGGLARRTTRENICIISYDREPDELIRIITGE